MHIMKIEWGYMIYYIMNGCLRGIWDLGSKVRSRIQDQWSQSQELVRRLGTAVCLEAPALQDAVRPVVCQAFTANWDRCEVVWTPLLHRCTCIFPILQEGFQYCAVGLGFRCVPAADGTQPQLDFHVFQVFNTNATSLELLLIYRLVFRKPRKKSH